MSDEEKKAIRTLEMFEPDDLVECSIYLQCLNKVKKLIKKQSKEIKELSDKYTQNICKGVEEEVLEEYREKVKEREKRLQEEINENCKLKYELYGNSISKNKLKEILGLEEGDDDSEEGILNYIKIFLEENARLEDIEDKKVQVEYNNVFNKGVKSVEDKIKSKIEEQDETKQYWTDEVKDILKSLLRKE